MEEEKEEERKFVKRKFLKRKKKGKKKPQRFTKNMIGAGELVNVHVQKSDKQRLVRWLMIMIRLYYTRIKT